MTLTYRTPGPDDAVALAELSSTTFVDTFAHLYSPENLNSFLESSYAIAQIAADIANPRRVIQIAEEDGQMVGYCKLGLDVTLADVSPEFQRGIELKQLYMRSSQFGKGTAATLMNWAVEQATSQNAPTIVLSVWSENVRAQRFYKRHGFAHIGDTYFMVGNHRDDEFLYGLKLDTGSSR